jgi:hypothetical protein
LEYEETEPPFSGAEDDEDEDGDEDKDEDADEDERHPSFSASCTPALAHSLL